MKKLLFLAFFATMSTGLFAQQTPASQEKKEDMKELKKEVKDIKQDKRERRQDIKNGDKLAAKQETRDIKADKKEVHADIKELKADGVKHPVARARRAHRAHPRKA